MNIKKFITQKNIMIGAALIFLIGVFCIYQVYTLKVAHSSFENYYKFRGCTELLEKTDSYATCTLSSGKIIKLVQVNKKWFLDGDFGW